MIPKKHSLIKQSGAKLKMPYQLLYHPDVAKRDLPSINRNLQKRIQKAIEFRLVLDPVKCGEPLRRGLKGFHKLRVGDYRVIYEIVGTKIYIYTIGHRKEVYETRLRDWPPD